MSLLDIYWQAGLAVLVSGLLAMIICQRTPANPEHAKVAARVAILAPLWPLCILLGVVYLFLRGLAHVLKTASGKRE